MKKLPVPMIFLVLLFCSCNTEASYMPWYLSWTTQAIPFESGSLDAQGSSLGSGFHSFRLPDGTVWHVAVREQGAYQPVKVLILDQDYQPSYSFSTTRLSRYSPQYSYVDERGKLHLRDNWSGEVLTPPSGSSGWTKAEWGDSAYYNRYDGKIRRVGSSDAGGTFEFTLDLSAYPTVGLAYGYQVHASDGSTPVSLESSDYQHLVLATDGFADLLGELYPGLAAESLSNADIQAKLAANSAGPDYTIIDTQLDAHPTLGWNRPVVRVLFYLPSQYNGSETLPASELMELDFPLIFSKEDGATILSDYADTRDTRVYSQSQVFSDASLAPESPLDITADSWALCSSGLVLARYFTSGTSACRYMLRFDKDADARHDKLLVIPDSDNGESSLYRLPLLSGETTEWLIWDSLGSTLYVNRPWWSES